MVKITPLALLSAVIVTLWAGSASSADDLDSAARQAAVERLAETLRERYVYPDVGVKLADTMTANMKAGAYDSLSDPVRFTAQLTADLYAGTHDKHLYVKASNSPRPNGLLPQPRNEAGIVRADKLPGGIGYIEVSNFPPLAQFKPVVDQAMSALAGSKALIIDDRRNIGGAAASVSYLVSFLVPPSTHINDLIARTPDTTAFTRQEFRAQTTSVNFAGRPIIVLTSGTTISGGEEFAYDLQSLKAAMVIGETTAGGANPTAAVALNANLTAYIPFARAENPVTKTNWEGKGVQPEIEVPASDAFKVALAQLGGPAVADVATASQAEVFAPRSTSMPGSQAALRRLIDSLISNTPNYAELSPQMAEAIRQRLPQLHEDLAALGAVQSVKFAEVDPQGGDRYDITFAHGARKVGVLMTPDGKIQGWAWIAAPRGSGG